MTRRRETRTVTRTVTEEIRETFHPADLRRLLRLPEDAELWISVGEVNEGDPTMHLIDGIGTLVATYTRTKTRAPMVHEGAAAQQPIARTGEDVPPPPSETAPPPTDGPAKRRGIKVIGPDGNLMTVPE